jgi:nitrilase
VSSWRVAAIQMVSGPELEPNLAAAGRLVAAAAAAGARLAALPENFYLIGNHEGDKVKLREAEGNGPVQKFLSEVSRKNRVWILAGTTPISSKDGKRVRGACLVYDDAGERVAPRSRWRSRARSDAWRCRFATMCASPSSTAGSASSM